MPSCSPSKLSAFRSEVYMFVATLIAEISFWVCLFAGFILRYPFKMPRVGMALLVATPIIDFILLVFSYLSLQETGEASFFHGVAAFYIAFSLVFGYDVIRSFDRKYAGKGSEPADKAARRKQFLKCVLACIITAILLGAGLLVTGKEGSFWLLYWLIAVAFTPAIWWVVDRYFVKKND